MKYLAIATFMLLALITLNAQNLTKAQVAGTYHITKYMQGDEVIYSEATDLVVINAAMKDLKASNPKYTVDDSLSTVGVSSLMYSIFSTTKFNFRKDGVALLTSSDGASDTAHWEFNEFTQDLTTSSPGEKTETLPVKMKEGKIIIVGKEADGSGFELTKE